MKYHITWLREADRDYEELASYLQKGWGQKSAKKLKKQVEAVLKTIEVHPRIGAKVNDSENTRKIPINKHTSIYYHILDDKLEIEVLFLWNNRRNPDDLPL